MADSLRPDLQGKFSHSLYITVIVETGLISAILFFRWLLRRGWDLFRILPGLKTRAPDHWVVVRTLLASFLGLLVLELGYSSLPALSLWVMLAVYLAAPSRYAAIAPEEAHA